MRVLLHAKFPHEQFNAAVRDGTVGKKMARLLEELKPEAVYFAEYGGRRSALVFVDLADPSHMPALAEPFFLAFGADVELHPAMNLADLERGGLEALGKKW